MDSQKVDELVLREFNKWNILQIKQGREAEISNGAVKAISQMVINIKEDPSNYWGDINTEEIQMYAIQAIPNVLNDIFLRYPRRVPKPKKITSWEIWHGISYVLDSWCPIPKNF